MNMRRDMLVYVVAILALSVLIGVAFYSPGWIFRLQDGRQCSDTVLEERENMDVAVLSTNYETSFYHRMINFAENQGSNTNYYVASEELTDYEQLREFLYSENGLYNDRIWALIDIAVLTDEIFECEINAWKQYVIYSDDYTKGVNFILWYIELEHPEESIGTYKLLLEADTGELYGLKAYTGGTYFSSIMGYNKDLIYYDYSLEDYFSLVSGFSFYTEAWMTFAYFYSGLTESNFFQFYELYHGAVDRAITDADMKVINSAVLNEVKQKIGIEDVDDQWLNFLSPAPALIVWDEGNRLECNFPYGESSLIFRLQMAESVPFPWTLHNITIGFPAIYELIPEFE